VTPVPTSASAQRIIVEAERLFARFGIDGVSLRQIAAEAGSANNSAVHYHFGSKDGLITAIFRHRLPQLLKERQLLESRCDPNDLRSRIEAYLLPVLTMAEAPDNNYVSFVEQLNRRDLGSTDILSDLPTEGEQSNEKFRRDLDQLLEHLPLPLRRARVAEAQRLCLHAAADRERAVFSGGSVVPFGVFVDSLLDGMTGFLAAPASVVTLARQS
jgi:AcrR family transcriptional regulator